MVKIVFHAVGQFLLSIFYGVGAVRKVEEKPCIVVANHNTHIDILVLFRLFPLRQINRVKVIAAEDYFSRGLAGFCARFFLNMILVDRKKRKTNALQPLREALRAGYSVILFPEGTRGRPGVLEHFKTGVGALALEFPDIPVYPVLLKGVERTMPRGHFFPVPFTISIHRAEPEYGAMYLSVHHSVGRKEFTARLEEKIRQLSEVA